MVSECDLHNKKENYTCGIGLKRGLACSERSSVRNITLRGIGKERPR